MERYTLAAIDGLALPAPLARPRFNIARGQDAAVAVRRGRAREGGREGRDGREGREAREAREAREVREVREVREIVAMRWGLLAPWRGHGGKRGPMTYAAPRDAIEAAPLLRDALRAQRCLVLADGFFAWRRAGKRRQPYWIHPAAPGPVALAGLWAVHRDDGRESFAVVTAPAAGAPGPIAAITAEVPLLAPRGGDAWLDDLAAARALLAAPPALDGWRADPVSPWVDDAAHDDPRCIAPLGNPAQGELF